MQVASLPNAARAAGARFLYLVGCDVVGGGSMASGSAEGTASTSGSAEGSTSVESMSASVIELREHDATQTRGLAEAMWRIQQEVKKDEFTKEKMALVAKM